MGGRRGVEGTSGGPKCPVASISRLVKEARGIPLVVMYGGNARNWNLQNSCWGGLIDTGFARLAEIQTAWEKNVRVVDMNEFLKKHSPEEFDGYHCAARQACLDHANVTLLEAMKQVWDITVCALVRRLMTGTELHAVYTEREFQRAILQVAVDMIARELQGKHVVPVKVVADGSLRHVLAGADVDPVSEKGVLWLYHEKSEAPISPFWAPIVPTAAINWQAVRHVLDTARPCIGGMRTMIVEELFEMANPVTSRTATAIEKPTKTEATTAPMEVQASEEAPQVGEAQSRKLIVKEVPGEPAIQVEPKQPMDVDPSEDDTGESEQQSSESDIEMDVTVPAMTTPALETIAEEPAASSDGAPGVIPVESAASDVEERQEQTFGEDVVDVTSSSDSDASPDIDGWMNERKKKRARQERRTAHEKEMRKVRMAQLEHLSQIVQAAREAAAEVSSPDDVKVAEKKETMKDEESTTAAPAVTPTGIVTHRLQRRRGSRKSIFLLCRTRTPRPLPPQQQPWRI